MRAELFLAVFVFATLPAHGQTLSARTHTSNVTIVKNRPIFIQSIEPKPVDIFGRPLVWSLTLPDRDSFVRKLEAVGPQFRKRVRCAEGIE